MCVYVGGGGGGVVDASCTCETVHHFELKKISLISNAMSDFVVDFG